MAQNKYESYKELKAYREADKSVRREMDAYIKKYHPSNDEMYLQLKRYELKNLSRKEKRTPNGIFTIIMLAVRAVLYFLLRKSLNGETNTAALIIALIIMSVLYFIYYKGWFSASKTEIKKIDKELADSKMPEFTSLNSKQNKDK